MNGGDHSLGQYREALRAPAEDAPHQAVQAAFLAVGSSTQETPRRRATLEQEVGLAA